ncbi:hypothetical protein ACTAQJ_05760 [Arthrobacter sp. alpha11c]
MPNVTPTDPSMAVAAVLDLLIQQGYEATSVEELADASRHQPSVRSSGSTDPRRVWFPLTMTASSGNSTII